MAERLELLDDGVRLLLEALDEGGQELGAVDEVEHNVGAARRKRDEGVSERPRRREEDEEGGDGPDLLADHLAVGGVRHLEPVALLGRDGLQRLGRRDAQALLGKGRVVEEVAQPSDGRLVLLLGDLHAQRDALLERLVDVDVVGERLGVELLDDLLEVELGAVGARDGQGEEGVEVDGEERAQLGRVVAVDVVGEEDDGDLDEARFDVCGGERERESVSASGERAQSRKAGRTVELDEERQLGTVGVDMLLRTALGLARRLRYARTARRVDVDPLDAGHVGHLELAQDVGRHGLVVLGLGRLDVLLQLGEAVGPVLGLVGVNERLGVVLDLFGERGRRLADDGERRRVDEEPAGRRRVSREARRRGDEGERAARRTS